MSLAFQTGDEKYHFELKKYTADYSNVVANVVAVFFASCVCCHHLCHYRNCVDFPVG
eukprot:CAMPEP_0202006532 /NCGR_PEP_ID=MMETSP0905-20130828/11249_1 /ASSEMBLY_ACC=CAM_ASM_000554 /TAXON_ID=420261 /ORGANISM="Thalassiosira antarctica, Strain CCMP982" /LENGTH=56 /DNA_ID=CAMNT_0048564291 /DNA_START=447 /DNA_END=614 /DNA_ORIENTATION=+